MKRSILVVLAIGVLLSLGTVVMAGTNPGTGIKGTAHDMSSGGLGAAYGNDVGGLDRMRLLSYPASCERYHYGLFTSLEP